MSLPSQAVIKLRSDGEYCVVNEGRRPLYIDGKPVVMGTKARLHHNSTFEVNQSIPSFCSLIPRKYSLSESLNV